MTTERHLLVRHRLDRAQETLDEARLLGDSGHWNACVNRLYYACFYAVTALLLQHGLSSAKHSGVRSLFNHHFVRPGIITRDMGSFYRELFDNRQKSDYLDFARFDPDQVHLWIGQVERFVRHIDELLGAGQEESLSD